MRTVLITGATRNTGYGIAKLFAQRGWAVIVTSKNPESVEDAVKKLKEETGGEIIGFAHDVRQTDKVEELLEKVKKAGYTPDSVVLNGAMLGVGTNPSKIMYALKRNGYKGLILDDHVPFINNDTRWGHTARANAFGYLRGMQKALDFLGK